MRSIFTVLALIIASAPAMETLAGSLSHAGCGSASSHPVHDAGDAAHAAHRAAADAPVPSTTAPDPCDCGCDCGPGHGCTAASAAAPATSGAMVFIADAVAPPALFQPHPSRVDSPLYRPPITRLTF